MDSVMCDHIAGSLAMSLSRAGLFLYRYSKGHVRCWGKHGVSFPAICPVIPGSFLWSWILGGDTNLLCVQRSPALLCMCPVGLGNKGPDTNMKFKLPTVSSSSLSLMEKSDLVCHRL